MFQCGGLVDIQLTGADSHGDCLSIALFSYTLSAHLIKLPINSINQARKLTTNTRPSLKKSSELVAAPLGEVIILAGEASETEEELVCSRVSGTSPDPWPHNHLFPHIPQLRVWSLRFPYCSPAKTVVEVPRDGCWRTEPATLEQRACSAQSETCWWPLFPPWVTGRDTLAFANQRQIWPSALIGDSAATV